MTRAEEWTKLNLKIEECEKCPLHRTCNRPIPGDGPVKAKVFIVGEAPGRNEDIQHKPFVGASGKLLTKQLERIGLGRKRVFITNIVKCRPPDNRTPKDDERDVCAPYLSKQLAISKPKVVVTVGRVSGDFYRPECNMGTIKEINDKISGHTFLHFAMYHPAACLYQRTKYLPLFEKHFDKLAKIVSDVEPLKKQTGLAEFFK